ncbi:hypothetical protein FOXYSP1_11944 [Fusarium oxysporum f. sp. phaseoli]
MDTLACFVLPRLIVLAWMVSVCIATRQQRQEHELRDSKTYAYYLR